MNSLNSQGRLDSHTLAKLLACAPIEKRPNHDGLAKIILDLIDNGTLAVTAD